MDIRILRSEDDRASFRSGDPDLDRFFHKYAGQNQFRHHVGTTYVAADGAALRGFVTMSVGHLERERLPGKLRKSLPAYPLPILRIARLAVAEAARGRGVGMALMQFALLMALRIADEVGCIGVLVDAKPAAISFYERLGFFAISVIQGISGDRPAPTPMLLPLSAIEKAVK